MEVVEYESVSAKIQYFLEMWAEYLLPKIY